MLVRWVALSAKRTLATTAPAQHRLLNTKFKQCGSALDVEQLIAQTDEAAFDDTNCAAAMRQLARRRSSDPQAIGKVVSVSSSLAKFAPHCLSDFCYAACEGRLLTSIPAPIERQISRANFHKVSPVHVVNLLWSLSEMRQDLPAGLLHTFDRTLFHDFTSRDVSLALHVLSTQNKIKTSAMCALNLALHVLSDEYDLATFSSKHLCQTWQALVRLNVLTAAGSSKFTRHVLQRDLRDFNTRDLGALLSLTASSSPNLTARLEQELATRPTSSSVDESLVVVSTFYKFTPIPDCVAFKRHWERLCAEHDIRGTVLMASEGVNATICGSREDLDTFYRTCELLLSQVGGGGGDVKESTTVLAPFHKMMVRLKPEVVAMGVPNVQVTENTVGEYVHAKDWDQFTSSEDVVVIDTRNEYEIGLGTFDMAVNPGTLRFKDFPAWFRAHKDEFANKRVAMFCTGGVRCEKSTAFAKQVLDEVQGGGDGKENRVFHLQGGILAYLQHKRDAAAAARKEAEETRSSSSSSSTWTGECFVFDDRIAVNTKVEPSSAVPSNYKAEACREVVQTCGVVSSTT